MSVLSDLFIASPEQADRYSAVRPADWERIELNGLTYHELSELWAVLERTPWSPTEARRIIDAASRLARLAEESGKSLYLFMRV